MFDMQFSFEDIDIDNVKEGDLRYVQKWFNYHQFIYTDDKNLLDYKGFYDKFLEYYLTEGEFFLKISKNKKFIGILRGRIEFKSENEAWFICILIDGNYRNKGIGTKVLNETVEYLHCNYGISRFLASISKEKGISTSFWKHNGFKVLRVAKEYYRINEENVDMVILERNISGK